MCPKRPVYVALLVVITSARGFAYLTTCKQHHQGRLTGAGGMHDAMHADNGVDMSYGMAAAFYAGVATRSRTRARAARRQLESFVSSSTTVRVELLR